MKDLHPEFFNNSWWRDERLASWIFVMKVKNKFNIMFSCRNTSSRKTIIVMNDLHFEFFVKTIMKIVFRLDVFRQENMMLNMFFDWWQSLLQQHQNDKSAGRRLVSWPRGVTAKGIPGISPVVMTSASLGYPLSVLNKNFTFTEMMSKDIIRRKQSKKIFLENSFSKKNFEFFEFLCGELLLYQLGTGCFDFRHQ